MYIKTKENNTTQNMAVDIFKQNKTRQWMYIKTNKTKQNTKQGSEGKLKQNKIKQGGECILYNKKKNI